MSPFEKGIFINFSDLLFAFFKLCLNLENIYIMQILNNRQLGASPPLNLNINAYSNVVKYLDKKNVREWDLETLMIT